MAEGTTTRPETEEVSGPWAEIHCVLRQLVDMNAELLATVRDLADEDRCVPPAVRWDPDSVTIGDMDDAEVVALLERMTGYWPSMPITAEVLTVWMESLTRRVDVLDAMRVATKAGETLDRPPTVAWFLRVLADLRSQRGRTAST